MALDSLTWPDGSAGLLDDANVWVDAAAYAMVKRRSGAKLKPLPDFFIGAHAAVANLSVLTRDPKPYRSYFARLKVISP